MSNTQKKMCSIKAPDYNQLLDWKTFREFWIFALIFFPHKHSTWTIPYQVLAVMVLDFHGTLHTDWLRLETHQIYDFVCGKKRKRNINVHQFPTVPSDLISSAFLFSVPKKKIERNTGLNELEILGWTCLSGVSSRNQPERKFSTKPETMTRKKSL